MIEFYSQHISPSSPARAKLSVHLVAQAKSDVSTKQISELVKTLGLGGGSDSTAAADAAADLQARLSAASAAGNHDVEKEVESLKAYLLHDLKVAEDHIEAAAAAWRRLHEDHARINGVDGDPGAVPVSHNGTEPVVIEDVRDFKSRLAVTAGPMPVRELSEYEELDSKL